MAKGGLRALLAVLVPRHVLARIRCGVLRCLNQVSGELLGVVASLLDSLEDSGAVPGLVRDLDVVGRGNLFAERGGGYER